MGQMWLCLTMPKQLHVNNLFCPVGKDTSYRAGCPPLSHLPLSCKSRRNKHQFQHRHWKTSFIQEHHHVSLVLQPHVEVESTIFLSNALFSQGCLFCSVFFFLFWGKKKDSKHFHNREKLLSVLTFPIMPYLITNLYWSQILIAYLSMFKKQIRHILKSTKQILLKLWILSMGYS